MMKAMKTEMCIRVCRAVYRSVNLKIRQYCDFCHPDTSKKIVVDSGVEGAAQLGKELNAKRPEIGEWGDTS